MDSGRDVVLPKRLPRTVHGVGMKVAIVAIVRQKHIKVGGRHPTVIHSRLFSQWNVEHEGV
jgi:hypothetical protein